MKGKKVDMINLRQVLQRLRAKQSIRSTASEMDLHRRIVRKMHSLAIEQDWLNSDDPMPTDEELMKAWAGSEEDDQEHILDAYKEKIQEWNGAKCTAVVIQRLLKDAASVPVYVDIQVIRRYLRKHQSKEAVSVMVRDTVPGQDADVDFGDIGVFEDETGAHKKAYLFSLKLRYSRKAYREIVTDQTSITFNKAHVHALEFFDGVVRIIHPDCTKCAVIKASIENDKLNKSYQSLAEHSNFMISPCRPYTPKHKGGVEKDMDYVKRNCISYFRAQQRELGITTPKIKDLKIALEKWQREVDDVHKIYGIDKTPKELFEEEKTYLQDLPKERWDVHIWAQCRVRNDWRILWDNGFYAVPYKLIGEQVDLCATTTTVRIFHKHAEVALHERCTKKWEYKRKSEFAPPFKEAVLQCTRDGVLELAKEIGVYTHRYAEKLLSTPGIDKLGPVRNILRLAEKHGKESLEKACIRALHFQLNSYGEIKNILENKMEEEPLTEAPKTQEEKKACSPKKKYKYERDAKEYRHYETWDEQVAKAYPVSKYGHGALGAQLGKQADDQMDELIKEEKKAVAEGREGPLHGEIPPITEAWYRYYNIPVPEKDQPSELSCRLQQEILQ